MIAPSRSNLGMWVVLALAAAVRVGPMIYEQGDAPEQIERANLTDNLVAGRGFRTDIKTNWVNLTMKPGPEEAAIGEVTHFGGYDQPVLPVYLTVLARRLAPRRVAPALSGVLLFLVGLVFMDRLLRRLVGPETAYTAGLLLALCPALVEASVESPVAASIMAATALGLWASLAESSGILTGLACTLGFLAHPGMIIMAPLLAWPLGAGTSGTGRARALGYLAIFCLAGPAWLATFNKAVGEPAMTLPGAWLLHVVGPQDGRQSMQAAEGHAKTFESVAMLLQAEWRAVAGRVAVRAERLGRELASPGALGLLLAFLPLAAVGIWQGGPLRRVMWLAPPALALLALDAAAWSLEGGTRLVAVAVGLTVAMVAAGTLEVIGREPVRQRATAWRSAAVYALATVAVAWAAMDVAMGVAARRGAQAGGAPAAGPTAGQLAGAIRAEAGGDSEAVLATNEPWRLHTVTGLPTMLLPYDLEGERWGELLDRMDARVVAVEQSTWPAERMAGLVELTRSLSAAGWQTAGTLGTVVIWRRAGAGGNDQRRSNDGRMGMMPMSTSGGGGDLARDPSDATR